ncbi:RsmF rRNA methyltransferase first C-terminal domain-containing protein [Streptococcus pacificus]|uniref:RsmF rRNA methyltransferase first C-terminal domain-containing protein n=1 Tax=Streptococcus pacificus TaxID=2740577 RepID=A0ABS0ZHY9_9STRE|nr:RsmB/NOP family class I SAM-dependent RNA methyltransferase [Streptococcus pacificus]MBJ8325592.1 RsmF rRNA methyltransferase first C-terminal domain-containing protein [Streptococcus pacificus]
MNLPKDFVEKYNNLLKTDGADFIASFEKPAISGFRVNPLKKQLPTFPDPIPQTPWGYYGKISGHSIAHVSGVVYSQEPAAQMVGQIAAPKKGERVLDLAAAPGGKSTHLLSYLQHTGILVSNEISTKRSKVLVENIERFGGRNVVVTNESLNRLAAVFKDYFDLIVLDAPCSGEGMFRKNPEAIKYWDTEYPQECSLLQKEILRESIKMLAPGGRLVYSTCTWAPEENEEVVSWLLEAYDFLELEPVDKINGMKEGINLPQTARMYPHLFKGEGQFVAKLIDKRKTKRVFPKSGRSNLTKQQLELWVEFQKTHLRIQLEGVLQSFGQELYLLPNDLPDLSKLKIARNGLHLGTFKKNRFEPSFALGVALTSDETISSIAINEDDFKQYLSGNIITLEKEYPKGWYQLLVAGNGLGFVKIVGKTIKNFYPKGLRTP